MDVVEDDDARSVGRDQAFEVGDDDFAQDRRRLGRIGRHVRGLRLPAAEGRGPGDRRDAAALPSDGLRIDIGTEQQLAREAAGVDAVLVGDGLGEGAREPVRLTAAVRHALGPRPGETEGAGVGLELGRETRLAHARVTGHQDDRAAPRPPDPTQHLADAGGLLAAPDERTGARRAHAVRPHQPELAGERVQMHHGRLAAKHDRSAIVDLEPVAPAPDRRLVEEDLARSRERLDARGRGDRLAGDREVAGPVIARGRDHLAGGDADPDLERLATVERFAQRGTDGQRRKGRPDRVVVVGTRPAEHREHRIADELLARALEAFDGVGHPAERRADARAHLLGIDARRSSGRSRRGPRRAR